MVQPRSAPAGLPVVVGAVLQRWPRLKFSILLAFGPIVVTVTLTLSGLLGGTAWCVALTTTEPVLILNAAMTPRLFLRSSPPCLVWAPLNLLEPRTWCIMKL